ncbi:MAG: response regulator transcription factor [Sulfurimonas sp.]|jgi:DNA-binding NarL/FixJ family response regulator|nr:response regulator transcription factor [Sulfurimonadaceae bacterium]
MQIVLFCDDALLVQRWVGILEPIHKTKLIKTTKALLDTKNSLVVFYDMDELEDRNFIILRLLQNKNRLLFLSRTPELAQAKELLALGISGYSNALMNSSFFLSAIDAITQGYVFITPQITSAMLKDIATLSATKKDDEILAKLTAKEQEVAKLLKEGYKNQDIADSVGVSINTIKAHIKAIYEKLEVKDRLSFAALFIDSRSSLE